MRNYSLGITELRMINTKIPNVPPRITDKININKGLVLLSSSIESMSYVTDVNVSVPIGVNEALSLVLITVWSCNIFSFITLWAKAWGTNNSGVSLDERRTISLSMARYPRR